MRPVELTVDGFRSYGRPTTFTWSDRGLVGIVGPIGSGKSSILDAIAFALYARVPAFERDVKRLINQRRNECHVGLTFDVDGRRFAVERAMRRKGAAGHVLREIVDGSPVLVSDRAKEIAERVEELLGLDFDAFRRSVLLAQNRFAEFLQATPVQRDAVLEGVFPRFGRIAPMRDRGKGLLTLVAARLETATMRRRDLATDRAALEGAIDRRKAEEARLGRLQG
ncbi:MAG TPA: SMC family ATPase, partial [Acidimicrobiia bacterium]|nr:SMC family ATPase [Acidimicrobiia bacterium]